MIMIGIFSYNEGYNVARVVEQVFTYLPMKDFNLILLDESTEEKSLEIVSQLSSKYPLMIAPRFKERRGKTFYLNYLYELFLSSDCEVLIHIDGDLTLHPEALGNLVRTIESGFDIATGMSVPNDGKNFVQTCLVHLALIFDSSGSGNRLNAPLVGHFGAYSRKAVSEVYPIPNKIVEDLYILETAMATELRTVVDTNSICFYNQPMTIKDYISNFMRNAGGAKEFFHTKNKSSFEFKKTTYYAIFRSPINFQYLKEKAPEFVRNPAVPIMIALLVTLRALGGMIAPRYKNPTLNVIASTK
jgi:cellulose synthase/poly-beta-1,6-N-acetylglucosamine synthase-like glycosyltransferase